MGFEKEADEQDHRLKVYVGEEGGAPMTSYPCHPKKELALVRWYHCHIIQRGLCMGPGHCVNNTCLSLFLVSYVFNKYPKNRVTAK